MPKPKIHQYGSRFGFIQEHAREQWHFDPLLKNHRDLRVIGRLHGDWMEEIRKVEFKPVYSGRKRLYAANPWSWKEIETDVLERGRLAKNETEAADAHWEYMDMRDVLAWGYSPDHIQYETCIRGMPAEFDGIHEKLFLRQGQTDLIRQRPGQATYIHTDTRLHEYGLRRIYEGDFTEPEFSRVLIALTPWDWGHYCMIGNGVWHQWKAGEMILLPWQAVHGTANCGRRERYFLSVTGYKTDAHREWIAKGEYREILL